MKYIRFIVALLAFCLLFTGCKNSELDIELPDEPAVEPTEAPFSRNGVKFDLPDDFSDYSDMPLAESYNFLYANSVMGIYGMMDIAGGLDEEISTYVNFVAAQAERYGVEAEKRETCWTFSYEDPEQNEPQTYICAIFESNGCFWSIYAYCPSEIFAENSETMWRYITTPVFE